MDSHRIDSGGGAVEAVRHGEGSDPCVFLCHGFGSDKEGGHRGRADFLARNGFSAVRFDFRGNGGSTGEFVEQTLSSRVEDLVSVVNYFEPEEYALFGASFGAKVAYFSLKELQPGLVTVKSPALLDRVMNAHRVRVERGGDFEFLPGKRVGEPLFEDLNRYSFGSVDVSVPFQLFQGTSDSYVPVQQTREAISSLDTRVEYHEMPGEGHSFSDAAEQSMRVAWIDFLRRHLT
jgi:Dipeptidyl aminopeptidases/acylaminoacyl-peptidases